VNPPIPVAIISNEQTPYRNHLHSRIVREVPEILLWSVFTHQLASSPWHTEASEIIRPVLFGKGERSVDQSVLRFQVREWKKGGGIINWCRDQGIRAVIINGYNDLGRIRLMRWCHTNRVPCFVFGDSNIRCDLATGIKRYLKRLGVGWVLNTCSGVMYCGRLGREYFLKYGASADRLFAFPYEPDYELGGNLTAAEIESVRCRTGLRSGARHLIYSGRLVGAKRVDLLLAAYKRIAAVRPDWDLVIAGDGPLRAELEAAVPAELRQRVVWAGFVDDPLQLATLYAAADVLVLPSDYEPWGVVVAEAAVHLAIVASSIVGAAADLVEDGVNGKIFRKGDADALTDALLEVTDKNVIDSMKAASPKKLDEWRRAVEPITNLRAALAEAEILRP
jgi:glycosyltransferase involved in cell wall biosynthesis